MRNKGEFDLRSVMRQNIGVSVNDKIMIIEDDESIRRLLEVALQSHGYKPAGFISAKEALMEMDREPPAVAIFDIMMDGMDGIEAVKRMRQNEHLKSIPVIMLTAKDTEIDKIVGLDAGADDYITKPFSVLELCARVRAQLRRTSGLVKSEESGAVLKGGEIRLNMAVREVTLSGNSIELTYKEFELLKTLMENQDKVYTRSELLSRIWGDDYYGETRTLDIHIGTLRQKLQDAAGSSRYIKTVRGVGYRFIGGREE